MSSLADALIKAGYDVCNIAYPSRKHAIAAIAEKFVAPSIRECFPDASLPVNFVTHSLGGIVVRQLAYAGLIENFGRVVMLSPPSQGSEVVDKLGKLRLFEMINGPAGNELGTGPDALPAQLGPAPFEHGIIAGTRSINLFLSLMIPGIDDGKVSVKRTKSEGMKDFLTVQAAHPFIMKNAEVIEQTIHFLRHGEFMHQRNHTSPARTAFSS
jgi:triacylglycerol lipase